MEIKNNKFTKREIKVLMVTGEYYPEINGAANQCRTLINVLKEKIGFEVLTITRNPNIPSRCQVDGVDVVRFLWTKGLCHHFNSTIKFLTFLLFHKNNFCIVHLHGFSLKSALLVVFSKIFDKKIIIKMTSTGHDDPLAIRQRGLLFNYFFSKADAYVSISPHFKKTYHQSRLPTDRLNEIPNGVDTKRFHPVTTTTKAKLRDEMGLPRDMKLILFVGHFSRDKCPDILMETWKQTFSATSLQTGIIFVGSTDPYHYEVEAELVRDIQHMAEPYLDENIFFIEKTHKIEKVYQSSDIFVLPSLREGMPNALLEAMSSGLPLIVSKLEGVTDCIVTDGINGLLVHPSDGDGLGKAIKDILDDDALQVSLGREARKTVLDRFSMTNVAKRYEKLYGDLISC